MDNGLHLGRLADPIDPNFDCIQGLLHGYSRRSNAVNAQNLRAYMRDLASYLDYAAFDPDANWEAILEATVLFPSNWAARFRCGDWPRS